jgi:hypothetical protein
MSSLCQKPDSCSALLSRRITKRSLSGPSNALAQPAASEDCRPAEYSRGREKDAAARSLAQRRKLNKNMTSVLTLLC